MKLRDHLRNDPCGVFVLSALDQRYELVTGGVFKKLRAFVAAKQAHRPATIKIAQSYRTCLLLRLGGRQQFEDNRPGLVRHGVDVTGRGLR